MKKIAETSVEERGIFWNDLPLWLKLLLVGIAGPTFAIRVIDLFYPLHESVQDITFIIFGIIVLISIFYCWWAQWRGKLDG